MKNPLEIPFSEYVDILLDNSTPLETEHLYRLSELEQEELTLLDKRWLGVDDERRRWILEGVERLSEEDLLLNFKSLCRVAFRDPDPDVRILAIRSLWELDDIDLADEFMHFLVNDPDGGVKAEAAATLGHFVYLGEIDSISKELLHNIEDYLFESIANEEDGRVQRRALESLGYSSRAEVEQLIETANESGDNEWIVSAVFAMGRSADQKWKQHVLERMDHPNLKVQIEACRAAGELRITESMNTMKNLLESSDEDLITVVIWSLSQIGGEGVREKLLTLFDSTNDEDLREYLDSALDNLAFTEEFPEIDLLDYPGEHDDERSRKNNEETTH